MRVVVALAFLGLTCSGQEHEAWDGMLKQYVSAEARVKYGEWKAQGVAGLDRYLESLAGAWPATMSAGERKAALINAYNALTVRWILTHYPVQSIWRTDDPFQQRRHRVAGESISLDELEGKLRAMGDPRIHAVLVCAARSCPPLRREAYVALRLDEQLEDNTQQWLGNEKLNRLDRERGVARVSSIFDWYGGDFASVGGVKTFLARYGLEAEWLEFEEYDWTLNDLEAKEYGKPAFYWDWVRNGYLWASVKWWQLALGFGVLLAVGWLSSRLLASPRRRRR